MKIVPVKLGKVNFLCHLFMLATLHELKEGHNCSDEKGSEGDDNDSFEITYL